MPFERSPVCSIDEVASALKMDRDVLLVQAFKAFLEKELRSIEAEIFEIRRITKRLKI